jgi:aconitate hydratase
MMRGTFANTRIKNRLADSKEGGYTKYNGLGDIIPIYDAAMQYITDNKKLVIFAGKEYGTGSSRDWAAKGTNLLGVKAVIAESFERIHRSNLVGMGVVPLVFENNNINALGLKGDESIEIIGLDKLAPGKKVRVKVKSKDGATLDIPLVCCIYTETEVLYIESGGILHYMLKELAK